MKSIAKNCLECNKEFAAKQSELKRGFGKFCSRDCSGAYNGRARITIKPPNCECAQCGRKFYRYPNKLKLAKHGFYFCCRHCKDMAQRIGGIEAMHPPHYGSGNRVDYRKTAFSHYNKICSECGWDNPSEILIVHHIDRNRCNNKISNLKILCPNCHAIVHRAIRLGADKSTPSP